MQKPKTVMKKWQALCDQIAEVRKLEMKKPKKDRKKKNLKTGPGRREARTYAAMAGMKSMGEVRCAADLDDKGVEWKYEHEKLEYQHEPQHYTPDFTLIDDDNILIEYKGKMTDETRKKLLSIKRCNPDRRLCIVFEQPNNKLSARPNATRYWQWAELHGFEWSDQLCDPDWLKED